MDKLANQKNGKKNGINNKKMAKKQKFNPLLQLLPYALRYKMLAIFAALSLIIAALVMLALPVAIRRMLDYGFTSEQNSIIHSYFAVLFILAAILALASAVRYYCVITLGERVVADLRRDLFHHIIKLSPNFYDRNHSGDILSTLGTDTTQIKAVVGATASVFLRNSIMALGAIIMMIFTSIKLSMLVLLALPIVVIPLVIFGRKVRVKTRQAQDRLADANALASENLSAIRTVQAFNAEKIVGNRFVAFINRALEATQSSILSRALLTGFGIFLVFDSIVAVLWIGSNDVLNANISAGTLGQFVLYAVLAASSFGQLSEVGGELAQASGAAERLANLLRETPQITAPKAPLNLAKPVKGTVKFDNVYFSYPTRPEQSALHGLSFQVQAGEKIAFVGASGAGKTTLFSLILRFYDPNSGVIKFDDTPIHQLDPATLRQNIAYVPQDVAIFNGSLRDNIVFGCNAVVDDAAIINAAKSAHALEFIQALKDGFNTEVGERGITLSGGQKQRIAIARAILRNAPLLLLDEATSALDAESESLVQQALDGLMQNRTTLIIAHRLATVLKADRILVLDGGEIVEQGNHEQLVAQNGIYARLAKLQFTH